MSSAPLNRGLVALLAVATGVAVANTYYAQPLLALIGGDLGLTPSTSALIVTAGQLGYAAGLAFLLPAGDLLERRRMLTVLGVANAIILVGVAASPAAWALLPALMLVGVLSASAQLIVPLAAHLADDERRGQVVGTVMSGLLAGILLARVVSGVLADVAGWRAVFGLAAVLVLVSTLALRRALPLVHGTSDAGYPDALRSVVALVREQPELRRRMIFGGLSFGQFTIMWTALTYHLAGAPFGWDETAIGAVGLVGLAGVLAARPVGAWGDRGWQGRLGVGATLAMVVSWVALGLGATSLLVLLVAILVLDAAVQVLQVTNQSVIYSLAPDARSRVNSAYMVAYFVGGAACSALAGVVTAHWGWTGACWLGLAVAGVLTVLVLTPRPRHP